MKTTEQAPDQVKPPRPFVIPTRVVPMHDGELRVRAGCTQEEVALLRTLRRADRLLKKVIAQHQACDWGYCICPMYPHWRFFLDLLATDVANEISTWEDQPVSADGVDGADVPHVVAGKVVS